MGPVSKRWVGLAGASGAAVGLSPSKRIAGSVIAGAADFCGGAGGGGAVAAARGACGDFFGVGSGLGFGDVGAGAGVGATALDRGAAVAAGAMTAAFAGARRARGARFFVGVAGVVVASVARGAAAGVLVAGFGWGNAGAGF